MIREVSPRSFVQSLEVFVKPRVPKWILLFCAALLLAACNADTSVLGPASEETQVQPVFAPSRSNAEVATPNEKVPVPAPQPRRGRYAMAAS